LTAPGGDQQESRENGTTLKEVLESNGEEATEETGEMEMSYGRISLESVEFLCKLGLEEDHVAEAGVVGVLKALDVEEDAKDVAVTVGTIDSPTKDFSVPTMAGYSKPDVRLIGFHASISN
jgi:hypothetical protein